MWGVGGVKGEEKWRWEGTGAPEGQLGEGKGSHAQRGKLRNHWESRGSKGSMARFPLPTCVPRNLLRSRAWSSAHRGPLEPCRSWGSGREGRGSKSKGGTSGTGTPVGWMGVGKSSYTQLDPHKVRGPAATGGDPGGDGGGGPWRNGREAVSVFPVHLGIGEPVGLLGLFPCPQSLPPAVQNPSPATTPTPRALPLHLETPSEIPSNTLDLNPTHTPSLRALPPNSRTPHSRRPPFHVLPLSFCAGPKQRPCPTL